MILREESWAELFLLCAIQWCLPLDPPYPLFSVTEHTLNCNNSKDDDVEQITNDVRVLNNVLARFRSLSVDPAEFACIKAIVLFKPGKKYLMLTISRRLLQISPFYFVTSKNFRI